MALFFIHPRVSFSSANRIYSNSNRYGHIFPTVNLSWNTPKAGRFTVSYVMGISRPAFGDLNPFRYYTTVSDYFSGNPDLKPGITHNAELNWSFKGIYAVVYTSHNRDAVGYVTRFNHDGSRVTLPENCLDAGKTSHGTLAEIPSTGSFETPAKGSRRAPADSPYFIATAFSARSWH